MDNLGQGDREFGAGEGIVEQKPLLRRGSQSGRPLKAAIIGGGKACDDLLQLLSWERLTRLNMEIIGVADVDPLAPGMRRARDLGIFTARDFHELYGLPGLNLLIELTGSMVLREDMIRSKPLEISSIDHRGARLLWDLIQMEMEKTCAQQEAEVAIRKERDWCQKVIDSLPDRIMVLNRDRTVHSVNRTFERDTGVPAEAIVGRDCREASGAEARTCRADAVPVPLEEVFRFGRTSSVTQERRSPEGKVVYEEIIATPILDERGEVVRVIEGIRDITSRRLLERQLRETEERLKQFLESAQDIICIKDLEGRYVYINPAGADSMGRQREEILGKTDADFFSPRVAIAMAERDRETLDARKPLFFREHTRIQGKMRHFHTVRFPIFDEEGLLTSVAVLARDMSEEIALQEEVARHKEYLENILQNSSDMILTTNLDGRVVTLNPAGERLLGYHAIDLVGASVFDLWKDPSKRRDLLVEVERHGAVTNYPAVLLGKDGREIEVSLSLSQLRDTRGQVLGTVGISKDMTEENRLRKRLLEQERLAAIGQTVAGVSHCMKNVLNGLKGGAYMLNVGLKRQDQGLVQEGWGTVQKGIERIGKLSLDMLAYCKDRQAHPIPADPLALARETMELVRISAEQSGIAVSVQGPEGPPVILDPDGVGRALLNLITNALDACREKEYRPGERPEVRLEVERIEDRLFFHVRDNGIGMDEGVKQKLFSRFFTTKEAKGTGLGLCVTKKILDENGAMVTVASIPGQGSVFSVGFPLQTEGVTQKTS